MFGEIRRVMVFSLVCVGKDLRNLRCFGYIKKTLLESQNPHNGSFSKGLNKNDLICGSSWSQRVRQSNHTIKIFLTRSHLIPIVWTMFFWVHATAPGPPISSKQMILIWICYENAISRYISHEKTVEEGRGGHAPDVRVSIIPRTTSITAIESPSHLISDVSSCNRPRHRVQIAIRSSNRVGTHCSNKTIRVVRLPYLELTHLVESTSRCCNEKRENEKHGLDWCSWQRWNLTWWNQRKCQAEGGGGRRYVTLCWLAVRLWINSIHILLKNWLPNCDFNFNNRSTKWRDVCSWDSISVVSC